MIDLFRHCGIIIFRKCRLSTLLNINWLYLYNYSLQDIMLLCKPPPWVEQVSFFCYQHANHWRKDGVKQRFVHQSSINPMISHQAPLPFPPPDLLWTKAWMRAGSVVGEEGSLHSHEVHSGTKSCFWVAMPSTALRRLLCKSKTCGPAQKLLLWASWCLQVIPGSFLPQLQPQVVNCICVSLKSCSRRVLRSQWFLFQETHLIVLLIITWGDPFGESSEGGCEQREAKVMIQVILFCVFRKQQICFFYLLNLFQNLE